MPPGGHTITARPLPHAYLRPPERRVLAWSREPWTDVEDYAHLEALRLPGSDPVHRRLIDHLAVNAPLTATAVEGIPNHDQDGHRLSDHTGCVVRLAKR
jgi:hypothetical protein